MLQVNEEDLKKRIKKILNKYSRVRSSLNKEDIPPSENREALWNIRADLELIIVEMKYLYNLKEFYEWQGEFKKTRGTANPVKATERLKKFKKSSKRFLESFDKNIEESFRYLWELKETISKNMKAFSYPTWIRRDKKFIKQSEKIFYV